MTTYLGDRLAEARRYAGLSQQELAQRSGVSLSSIRKLEQNERTSTRLATAHKLARPLGIPTSDLVSGRQRQDEPVRWENVYAALAGEYPSDTPEESAREGVRTGLDALMRGYSRTEFADASALLPSLIRDANALGRDSESAGLRSSVLAMAARILTQTRQFDAAETALARAEAEVPDRLRAISIINVRCFLSLRQGKLSEARTLAERWADDTEPKMSRASSAELAGWGWMLVRVAAASARDNRPAEAAEALRLARGAAVVLPAPQRLPGINNLPFSESVVAMQRAEHAMVRDNPNDVLNIAKEVNFDELRRDSVDRHRHLLDVAHAHARLRRYRKAEGVLLRIDADAPEWLPHQRYAQDVVHLITSRRRKLSEPMRHLARRVAVAV